MEEILTLWIYMLSPERAMVILTSIYVGVAFFTLLAIWKQSKIAAAQMKHLVSVERPWLLVNVGQLNPIETYPGGPCFYGALCTLRNFGKTPAWVDAFTIVHRCIEKLDPGPLPTFEKSDFAPYVLPPEQPLEEIVPWTKEQRDNAHKDQAFLYVLGRVLYHDFAGASHETTFCLRYYPTFRDNRAQGFHVTGPPEYNSQT